VSRGLATPVALAVLLAAGCGGGDEPAPNRAEAVVDAAGEPPYVGSLDVNPRDGSLLMATNAGTFRVRRGSDRIERVRVRISAGGQSIAARGGLAFAFTGPDRLVGSGHPGADSPQLLGLIRSSDGGRTWRNVSRLGQSDLHALAQRDRTVVASDGQRAQVLVSEDAGENFGTRPSPLRLIDMDASPDSAEKLVGSSEGGLYSSADGGSTWRARDSVPNSRLAWPAPGALFRVDGDGAVRRSGDAGLSWKRVGKVEGEPHALAAADARRLFAADIDGVIRGSRDGGRTWSVRARPGP